MPQKASAQPRPSSWITDILLKTLLPVALTAFAGYVESQAKKADLFALLENYREYILEVEGRECACPEEEP